MNIEFAHPWLLLLAAVAIALPFVLARRNVVDSLVVPFAPERNHFASWLSRSVRSMQVLSLVCLAIAASGPQSETRSIEKRSEGVDAIIALDISKSMETPDIQPTRIYSARDFASRLVRSREGDRFGLVGFSGEAATLSPLTADKAYLDRAINSVRTDSAGTGTAIGSALALSVALMEESEAKSKIIVLISDGESNAGAIPVDLAIRMAVTAKIKVYTVGVGSIGGAYLDIERGGSQPVRAYAGFNPKELDEIASATKGKYYSATSAGAFSNIAEAINSLEKSEILSSVCVLTHSHSVIFLWASLVLFSVSILCEKRFRIN